MPFAGIPGLPRVIDALSTIMWPSLVQSESTRNRRSRARDLLDWAREEEEDDGLRALVSPGDEGEVDEQTFDTPHSAKKSRMQREMDELEKWLEEDDQNLSVHHLKDHQAWIHPDIEALPDSWAGIPTPTLRISGSNNAEVNGFEDDFTEFVGAPVEVVYTHQERLKPHHTGTSYQSLASIEDTTVGDGDNDDPDLPSQAEIEQTTRKIFGNALLDASTSSHRPRSPAPNSIHASSSHLSAPGSTSTLPMTPDSPFSSFDHDNEDVDVEDDFELESFDLSRVLSALQGMKEEIAGMKDEGERRKAAARVALGLVYGLQKEEELDGVRTGGGR